ncbi:hypothetical protein V5O48_008170 [Marasmius crinis-equi]|uniref:ATP adenylyltransferase n=1 Tax=Marasmius crinis-equi TaxID=585013 RepID=A0ABR3FF36_9AGAR
MPADRALSEDTVLEAFDDLLARGKLIYGETKPVYVTDRGFDFEFRICQAFLTKPQLTGPQSNTEIRKFGPHSDIDFADDKLLLAEFNNGTHILVLNKFCVSRPQYILLTKDSTRKQLESLGLDEFKSLLEVFGALEGGERGRGTRHWMLYNCGEEAGSSRRHKHMQVFRYPTSFRVFPDRQPGEVVVPYKHFLRYLDSNRNPSAEELMSIYEELLEQVGRPGPHNVIFTSSWILVIPRTKANFDGADGNGAAMMGMVWVTDEEKIRRWERLGPARVLSQLGVPLPMER